jgi:dihydrofolate synthase / folylpolyglutamate synthase
VSAQADLSVRFPPNGFDSVEAGYRWFESFLSVERGSYRPRAHRLVRMRELLAAFGEPHRATPIVHVAGSKGKGSTAAFLAEILAEAGKRCGVYSSPHVESYRERVRVLDRTRPDAAFDDTTALEIFDTIARTLESRSGPLPARELPTTFELLTLFAFLVFRVTRCDVAVVEVGIGGRTDATNVVDPLCSVITPIELEHTEYLGTTLRAIAAEKGGVIKRRRPVFLAPHHREAELTLRRIAELRRAPLISLDEEIEQLDITHDSGPGLSLRLAGLPTIRASLRMPGAIQARNAALAALVALRLDPAIDAATVERGLGRAWLPGRSELVPGDPVVLLDGAHTPESIARLCETAAEIEPDRDRRIVIFGSVRGKKHETMLRSLVAAFATIVITRPGSFKESRPQELYDACVAAGGECTLAVEPADALARARESNPALLVVCGSFYLVGEVRPMVRAGAVV